MTVLIGEPRQSARFIENRMSRRGTDLVGAARVAGLEVSGFVAPGFIFVTEAAPAQTATASPNALSDADLAARLDEHREGLKQKAADGDVEVRERTGD